MAFGLGKLQVLESKLDIYEDLSKEMLDKLERAVATISENSNRVAVILERHENRLAEGEKSNTLILNMLEEINRKQKDENVKIYETISKLQEKVDENQKFVVVAGTVLTTIVAVLQLLPLVGWTLTPVDRSAILDKTPVVHVVS